MRRLSVTAGLAMALCAVAQPVRALLQTCTVSATAVSFGSYNPSTATALTGSGTITLSCSGLLSLLDSWTVALSAGGSGVYTSRQMTTGGKALLYNLYTNASRTAIWGDGSAGTSTVSQTELLALGGSNFNYTVYGQVVALQDRPPGTYTDLITVTVNY